HDLDHAATAQSSSFFPATEPAPADAERLGRYRSRRWPTRQPEARHPVRARTRVNPTGRR
ncbi:MAG TPA: hypothetical protein VGF64_04285, partial [Acidimicrobiales bacterium]